MPSVIQYFMRRLEDVAFDDRADLLGEVVIILSALDQRRIDFHQRRILLRLS